MKTITTTKIECDTSRIQFGYYDPDEDDFIVIESAIDAIQAAEKFQCSADLPTALATFAEIIRDAVSTDLRAIWKRLDEAGL
jgi:hypothetical protein